MGRGVGGLVGTDGGGEEEEEEDEGTVLASPFCSVALGPGKIGGSRVPWG